MPALSTGTVAFARPAATADGIFTPNESSTSGMLRALRDAGMLKVRE